MSLPVPICTALLTPDDAAAVTSIGSSIAHAMYARQMFRTETEMRISVLNAIHFPTPASRYWQAMREQCVMVLELTRLEFERRRSVIKRRRAQQAQEEARTQGDAIAFDEAQISVEEFALTETLTALEAKDRVREIMLWEKIKQEEMAADPTFDRDNVDAHQLVSYTKQFILRASISDPAKMSGGELDNLLGQLRASVARAVEQGVIKDVLVGLPKQAADLAEKQIKHFAAAPRMLNS